jgi:uncharacterized protein with HEPN domain
MRRERLYLLDIIKAADNIASMIAATDHDSFIADIILRQAVVYSLMTISEATVDIPRTSVEYHQLATKPTSHVMLNAVKHPYREQEGSLSDERSLP